ncbi:uncharacterized protein Z520_00324 [Fonsecaea multimorphosa CBS 102226]|uniref:Transcription factor domain-containing protein n=1 Tax=Fonsecaea multimorphosa CBS 102226 TaxID=1442371 RepID=A0A0D2KBZ0_9EURO|nr:uncharacterized protein Z520_00324 [Fonsecaea multimorphosa CBS 102226]KIY03633.1 hypothetical protein Z520_00324 [Fonsecaea multimorphosa CBS 102226]OAL32333.1 hypothetical protein AYO22_00355 [Fonsecaea multimorphosa]
MPLLFVNKDANNLERTSAEAFAIGSHISKTHRKWLKTQRLKQLEFPDRLKEDYSYPRTPVHGHSGASPSQSSGPELGLNTYGRDNYDADLAHASQNRTEHEGEGGSEEYGGLTNTPATDPSSAKTSAQPKDQTCKASPLLRPKFPVEPFSASVVPMTATVRELLALARVFHVFPAWPAKMSKILRDQLTQSFQDHLAVAIADEGEMNALLAAGYYAKSLICPADRAICFDRALEHKTKVLTILRQRIQRADHDQGKVFMLIRLLVALDFFSKDYEAARLHQGAMRKIISRELPSLKARQEMLSIGDVWLAAALLRHTEFHVGNWDPGARKLQTFDEVLRAADTNSTGQEGSTREVNEAMTQNDSTAPQAVPNKFLQHVLDDIRELVATKSLLANSLQEENVLRYEVVLWLHRRGTALIGRLINFYMDTALSTCQSSLPTASKDPDTLLNVTVALGMVLFLGAVFGDVPCPQIPLDRVAAVFGEKVKKLWGRMLRQEAQVDPDLFQWLLLVRSFHGHRMRCVNDVTGKVASEEGNEQTTLNWVASTLEFWCLMTDSNAPATDISDSGTPQREGVDDDPAAGLKRRLKRFLYLDAEMDEYLQMLLDCLGQPGNSMYLEALCDEQQANTVISQGRGEGAEPGENEDFLIK